MYMEARFHTSQVSDCRSSEPSACCLCCSRAAVLGSLTSQQSLRCPAPEQVGAKLIPVALRLRGGPKPAVLQAALTHLAARHEPLRMRFVLRNGQVLQAVAPVGPPHAAPKLAVEEAPPGVFRG